MFDILILEIEVFVHIFDDFLSLGRFIVISFSEALDKAEIETVELI